MRTLAALAVVALLAVSLAGCSSDDPERYPDGVPSSSASRSSSSSSSASRSSTSASTAPAPGDANAAPTGSLEASLNGTLANFTVEGSDADNDTLSWTLDFGDGNSTNGTALPATLLHNYTLPANTTAMNVTVVLTLSDGLENATYNATLNVTAGDSTLQAYSGGFVYSNTACSGGPPRYDAVPDSQGVTYDKVELLPETVGQGFKVTFAGNAVLDHLVFVDDDGTPLQGHEVGGPPDRIFEATGTIPAGAAAAVFYGCGVVNQPNGSVPPSGVVGESFDYSSYSLP